MITLFTTPKDFTENYKIIQMNAFKSWRTINPNIQIIVIGDSIGAEEAASSITAEYYQNVKCTQEGTPLINDLFKIAKEKAKYDILVYVNADIILPLNLLEIIKSLKKIPTTFLAVGSRWDLDVTEEINFDQSISSSSFWEYANKTAIQHMDAGIDYFIFKKTLFNKIPPLAIGRLGWDNWLLWKARRMRVPLINLTEVLFVVHQNHNYNYKIFKDKDELKQTQDAQSNKLLINDRKLTLRDTNWLYVNKEIVPNRSSKFRRRNLIALQKIYPEFSLLIKIYKKIAIRFGLYK